MSSDSGRWPTFDTGAAWLDLVATVGGAYGPKPVEHLVSARWLRDWLTLRGLRPAVPPGPADLADARALRHALRGIAKATVDGEPWPPAEVAVVNEFLAADGPV